MRRHVFSAVKVYGVFTWSDVIICVKPVEIYMIDKLKSLAPLGKSMACMSLIFAILFIVVPLYKSISIDFGAVLGCLVVGAFWWLLGKWYENETKDPYS